MKKNMKWLLLIFMLRIFFPREQNKTWAMERAKTNVIRWYPVVGILDYMEESLNALADEFPYFFKDAIRVYDHFRKYSYKYLSTYISIYFNLIN